MTRYAPEEAGTVWTCCYEIGWPDGTRKMAATGFDALQAVHLAMQMIGAELYTSSYHEQGQLRWGEPGEGYGFPVAASIRDLLIGDDKRFEA